jgi:hypothetical protein
VSEVENKTFFIKDAKGLLKVRNGKQALYDYATVHKNNPFYLQVEEIGEEELRKTFISQNVADIAAKGEIQLTQEAIADITDQIIKNTDLWKVAENIFKSYIFTYKGPEGKKDKPSLKGHFIDVKI